MKPMNPDDTVVSTGRHHFCYGPRVDDGSEVRPPQDDTEKPHYWGVYHWREDGQWEWWADVRTEHLAKVAAESYAAYLENPTRRMVDVDIERYAADVEHHKDQRRRCVPSEEGKHFARAVAAETARLSLVQYAATLEDA